MSKNIKMLLSCLIVALPSFTSLSAVLTQCNTCTSQSNYENIATYIAANETSTVTDVFIVNFNNNLMKKYKVIHIASREPGVPDTTDVLEQSLESSEINAFGNASAARNAITSSDSDIPENIAPSAYSLAGASYMQNNVSDYFNSNASVSTKSGTYLTSLGQISGKITNVPITIELSFSDKSTGIFQITPTVGVPLTMKVIQLKDADNNTIPLSPAGYQNGSFNFSKQGEAGIGRFINAAARFGVSITSGPGGGGSYSTSCVENGSDNLICTIIQS